MSIMKYGVQIQAESIGRETSRPCALSSNYSIIKNFQSVLFQLFKFSRVYFSLFELGAKISHT